MNPFFRVLLFIITVLFIGCNDGVDSKKEETVVCGVNDPINNLKWLHNEFKQFLGGPTGNGIV